MAFRRTSSISSLNMSTRKSRDWLANWALLRARAQIESRAALRTSVKWKYFSLHGICRIETYPFITRALTSRMRSVTKNSWNMHRKKDLLPPSSYNTGNTKINQWYGKRKSWAVWINRLLSFPALITSTWSSSTY